MKKGECRTSLSLFHFALFTYFVKVPKGQIKRKSQGSFITVREVKGFINKTRWFTDLYPSLPSSGLSTLYTWCESVSDLDPTKKKNTTVLYVLYFKR